MTVRTMWHRCHEAVKNGYGFLKDEPPAVCPDIEGLEMHPGDLSAMFYLYEQTPLFVIDEELVEMTRSKEFIQTLDAMSKADVINLPFPTVIVETMQSAGLHHFAIVEDIRKSNQPGVRVGDFRIIQFSSSVVDGKDCVALSPGIRIISVVRSDIEEDGISLKIHAGIMPFIRENPVTKKALKATLTNDNNDCALLLMSAILMTITQGVEHEIVDVGKLNRKRVASGKAPIPRHTYLRIGRVYRHEGSDESDEYTPRKSPRPHWRKGHVRGVRHGEGRVHTRMVFFPPRIVAYKPGAMVPTAHDYIVKK